MSFQLEQVLIREFFSLVSKIGVHCWNLNVIFLNNKQRARPVFDDKNERDQQQWVFLVVQFYVFEM